MGGEADDRMRWLDGITDGYAFEQTLGDGEGQGRRTEGSVRPELQIQLLSQY